MYHVCVFFTMFSLFTLMSKSSEFCVFVFHDKDRKKAYVVPSCWLSKCKKKCQWPTDSTNPNIFEIVRKGKKLKNPSYFPGETIYENLDLDTAARRVKRLRDSGAEKNTIDKSLYLTTDTEQRGRGHRGKKKKSKSKSRHSPSPKKKKILKLPTPPRPESSPPPGRVNSSPPGRENSSPPGRENSSPERELTWSPELPVPKTPDIHLDSADEEPETVEPTPGPSGTQGGQGHVHQKRDGKNWSDESSDSGDSDEAQTSSMSDDDDNGGKPVGNLNGEREKVRFKKLGKIRNMKDSGSAMSTAEFQNFMVNSACVLAEELSMLTQSIEKKGIAHSATAAADSLAKRKLCITTQFAICTEKRQLTKFAERLKTDENFCGEWTFQMSRLGGNTVNNFVFNILSTVLSDDLGLMFSGKGHSGGKEDFSQYKMSQHILAAILLSGKFNNANVAGVTTAVGRWLTKRVETVKRTSQTKGDDNKTSEELPSSK